MMISSLKDIVRGQRAVPSLDCFRRSLLDIGARCRVLLRGVSKLEFVRGVHVLDYELLRRSPEEYFGVFRRLACIEYDSELKVLKPINASPSDSAILDRLVERGILAQDKRVRFTDLSALLGLNQTRALYDDYESLRRDLVTAASASKKVHYYQ